MISYPGTFACPSWQYAESTSAFPTRTPFECGWTRQRRSEQDLYQRIGLSFVMTTTQYSIWSDWATNNGFDWFTIRLDAFDGERPEQEIRFIGPISYNYDAFDNVYVTVPAEVSNVKENVVGPPFPPPDIPPGPATACIEWTNSTSTATATDFWVSPTTEVSADYITRLEYDRLLAVKADKFYVQHGSNVVYTQNYGASFTTSLLTDIMPIDTVWSDGEKTSATFGNASWPNGLPDSGFTLTAWKWNGSDLVAVLRNSNGYAYVGNLTQQRVELTGWTWINSAETNSLKSTMVSVNHIPGRDLLTFTYFNNKLAVIGIAHENAATDTYDERHALLVGAPSNENSVMLSQGGGSARRMEEINGNLVWYGNWGGANGGALVFRYGYADSTIQFGGAYTFDNTWNGSNWVRSTASPIYQTDKTSVRLADNTNGYTLTPKQRPAKWSAAHKMFAGTTGKRYGSMWTNLDDAIEYDYQPEFVLPDRNNFEVVPVAEKGAFISLEILGTDGVLKASPTGIPGTFTDAVTFTLPVGATANGATVDYSSTQMKFLITYYDVNNKIHVVELDQDPFTCLAYEAS